MPGVTASSGEIERRLAILDMLIPALFLELGAIIFLGIGFGHERRPAQTRAPDEQAPPARPPGGPSGGGSRRRREQLVAEFETAYR